MLSMNLMLSYIKLYAEKKWTDMYIYWYLYIFILIRSTVVQCTCFYLYRSIIIIIKKLQLVLKITFDRVPKTHT